MYEKNIHNNSQERKKNNKRKDISRELITPDKTIFISLKIYKINHDSSFAYAVKKIL